MVTLITVCVFPPPPPLLLFRAGLPRLRRARLGSPAVGCLVGALLVQEPGRHDSKVIFQYFLFCLFGRRRRRLLRGARKSEEASPPRIPCATPAPCLSRAFPVPVGSRWVPSSTASARATWTSGVGSTSLRRRPGAGAARRTLQPRTPRRPTQTTASWRGQGVAGRRGPQRVRQLLRHRPPQAPAPCTSQPPPF